MTPDDDGLVSMTLSSGRMLLVSKRADGWWRAVDPDDPDFNVSSSDALTLREHAERLERLAQKIGSRRK